MSPRISIAALLLAVAVGAGSLWWSRRPVAPENGATPGSGASSTPAAGDPEGAPDASPQAPSAVQPPPVDPAKALRTEPAPPPAEVLEPVEAMLELNAASGGGAILSDASVADQSIDELLGGKHAGKTKPQLLLSLRSVNAVLEAQRKPELIAKDKQLSPEAIQALGIEAGWLKEQVYK